MCKTCFLVLWNQTDEYRLSLHWRLYLPALQRNHGQLFRERTLGKERPFSQLQIFNSTSLRILSRNPLLATLKYKDTF